MELERYIDSCKRQAGQDWRSLSKERLRYMRAKAAKVHERKRIPMYVHTWFGVWKC